jgi:hypothetical protein
LHENLGVVVSFLNENTTQTHNILTDKKLHDIGALLAASVKISFHLLNLHIGVLSLSAKGNRTCKTAHCAQLTIQEVPGRRARSWLVLVANRACVSAG